MRDRHAQFRTFSFTAYISIYIFPILVLLFQLHINSFQYLAYRSDVQEHFSLF